MISILDPLHGTVELSRAELRVVDSRPVQRLRHIKQLGFSELAFPGATHSRYAHSVGAMEMGTRMFNRLFADFDLPAMETERLRQTVRLAMLLHDIGHAPMSHVSERVMPAASTLGLPAWLGGDSDRQATHEDYSIKFLVDSELTSILRDQFGDIGITGERIASLILGRLPPRDPDAFTVAGRNLFPLLCQIVSSEMDADRMDYLRRDAYYCGVSYGNFDHIWLINNLTPVEHDGQWAMGLKHKGVWAFEDFLLARYHMFLSVYFHHVAICFDHLLSKFYESHEYALPSETEAYWATDDVHLLAALRASTNPWAKSIVQRQSYRLLVETHDTNEAPVQPSLDASLREAGVDFFRVRKRAILSKYFRKRDKAFPLWVVEPEMDRVRRIEEYTPIFRRFDDEMGVSRIFCQRDHLTAARHLLAAHRSTNKA